MLKHTDVAPLLSQNGLFCSWIDAPAVLLCIDVDPSEVLGGFFFFFYVFSTISFCSSN